MANGLTDYENYSKRKNRERVREWNHRHCIEEVEDAGEEEGEAHVKGSEGEED